MVGGDNKFTFTLDAGSYFIVDKDHTKPVNYTGTMTTTFTPAS
jgi:hypothetical protein